MSTQQSHCDEVAKIQEQINAAFSAKAQNNSSTITLKYPSKVSFTTRSKSYKNSSHIINCAPLNNIISIDAENLFAIVEPRVTMEQLVQTTFKQGLRVPVIPELSQITVGGAIMGGAAESSSHYCGCFNDICESFDILCGNGDLLTVSRTENPDLFYGLAGSYGSLGMLVSAKIRLLPAKDFVHLRYHVFSNPLEGIEKLQSLVHSVEAPEFVEGLVFSKNHAVIIEGNLTSKDEVQGLPKFSSQNFYDEWFYSHVNKIDVDEEIMSYPDYLFRYDRGAFWMGAYLLNFSFLKNFITEGLLALHSAKQACFTTGDLGKLKNILNPIPFWRTLFNPWLTGKALSKMLHRAEKWIQDRFIIQDFCIPESKAALFLEKVVQDPAIFPIWLCPMKGTTAPQIFAPHLIRSENQDSYFIDIGLYGVPSYSVATKEITQRLEQMTHDFGGRKVLYSHSYLTPEEFWKIYSYQAYQTLRQKTAANGIWHEITDKVLSD